jgi:hypothetical protein
VKRADAKASRKEVGGGRGDEEQKEKEMAKEEEAVRETANPLVQDFQSACLSPPSSQRNQTSMPKNTINSYLIISYLIISYSMNSLASDILTTLAVV